MTILRAQHLGMCFGVRDAIALAQQHAREKPLTVLGELVHNQFVLQDLRRHGVQSSAKPESALTSQVMITAHGASDKSKAHARSLGLEVLDATCPLVASAHAALRRLIEKGLHPIIVGKRDHVEVKGMTGDLTAFDVILCGEDVQKISYKPGFGIVAQTTQPIEKVHSLVELLRNRFSDSKIEFIDTVCRPTKQRQQAAVELAQECSVVIVVGGTKSNNTRELVATCGKYCRNIHHVQDENEVQAEWFGAESIIGITAGTSTPDLLIDSVEKRIREIEKSVCEVQLV
ncbi:MAG: (E)-4-hydroxy-3-methyl-but-2-enyl pyrophosphate reductase [Verrucomicrobiales bacterium]|nr:(E)-4-hydroxy-3-methyl-but-2-enyl pyrophosphate reductase [Verrucomicrobiales bacterium]